MSAVATEPKARARFAARRDAILEAATEVFAEAGVSGFTLAAVAKRLDLHPVSLTYYFKRKEDLAAACLMEALGRFGAMLDAAEREATAQARLRAFVALYFETRRQIATGEAPPLAPFNEITLIGGGQHKELLEAYRVFSVRIGRLFKDEALPWLTSARRYRLARLTIDQLLWATTWLPGHEPSDYGRLAERTADIMIHGLAAAGRAWPERPLLTLGADEGTGEEVTRERFLIAATELINRQGYRGASVDKISQRLGVTKGSFYHHNNDKDELAAACFERTFALIDAAKAASAAEPTGWERLWLAATSLAVNQALGGHGFMLRHYALSAVPRDMRHAMRARFLQIGQSFAGVISDGIADGSIRPVDPLVAAHLVMAMFNCAIILGVTDPEVLARATPEIYVRPVLLGFFTPSDEVEIPGAHWEEA